MILFKKKRLQKLVNEIKELTKNTYIFAKTVGKKEYLIEVPLGFEDSCVSLIKKHRIKIVRHYYFYNHAGVVIK